MKLLGPVEVGVDGRSVSPGGPMQRAALAAMALRSPDVVQRDDLIAQMWGAAAPDNAVGNLQNYVSALRRVLEPGRSRHDQPQVLLTVGEGYQLRLATEAVDVRRFDELAEAGYALLAGGDPGAAADAFTEALAWWRGEALADVAGPFAQAQRAAYTQRKLDVLEAWAGAMLAVGRADEVIDPLREATGIGTLRERLVLYLAEALAANDRIPEALQVCDHAQRELTDGLGVQPGHEFDLLRARLLGQAPPVAAPRQVPRLPAQLPHDIQAFTAREPELDRLRELLDAPPGAPRLAVLHGEAGAGKTALAVHFGLQVTDRFPDGQLYLDLRGFGPDNAPVSQPEALCALLRGLGIEHDRIPGQPEAMAGLLRTALAGKHVLVVLDNAADAAQVRPLLPGSDRCFVLVTSRNRMSGLAVSDDAVSVAVGTLAEDEALTVLGTITGKDRISAEPDAARELARACGNLPLPLRIVAERAAMRPRQPLAELLSELEDAEQRLDLLTVDDDTATARTVISWSYHALPPDPARLFRSLGMFPGPDVSLALTATLAGMPLSETESAIQTLVNTHLLDVAGARYRMHDLVRLYGRERFVAEEPPQERDTAVRRMLDWYLHGAAAADRWLAPDRRGPVDVGTPAGALTPPTFSSHRAAAAWCDAELPGIVAAVRLAAASGFRRHAWQIPHFLVGFFLLRSRFTPWIETLGIAIEQSLALGDRAAEARCRFNLIGAYTQDGRHTEVVKQCDELLASDGLTDVPGLRPFVYNTIGLSLLALDRPAEAAHWLEYALTGPDTERFSGLLANLGEAYTALGRYDEAFERHQQALTLRQERDDLNGQGASLRGLGDLHLRTGDHQVAVGCFRQARWIAIQVGNRRDEAVALRNLGKAHAIFGDTTQARSELGEAVQILENLGNLTADEVRLELSGLPPGPAEAPLTP